MISAGRIGVNGKTLSEFGFKVAPGEDQITLDGKLINSKVQPKVYWLFHKPTKTLTARPTDKEDKATIYDVPALKKVSLKLIPVGRLDYMTEGLLILTTDGEVANRLMHPRYKVPRFYYALVDRKLTHAELKQISTGLDLEDGKAAPAKIEYLHGRHMGKSSGLWYSVEVQEGKNRLVRRMFEKFDVRVLRLIRYGFGELRLKESLKPGQYVQLGPSDIQLLKKYSS